MTPGYFILHIEDNPADAELIRFELENYLPQLTLKHVSNKADFIQELDSQSYDLVLSDFNVPGFEGPDIFATFREYDLSTPFVFVSGTITGQTAVEIMRDGVTDYVLKENISKLPLVVDRTIRKARESERERLSEQQLFESEKRYRTLFENINEGLIHIQPGGAIEMINPSFSKMMKIPENQLVGKNISDLFEPSVVQWLFREGQHLRKGTSEQLEVQLKDAEDNSICILLSSSPLNDQSTEFGGILCVVSDITERKKAELEAEKVKLAFTLELEQKVQERTRQLDEARKELAASLEKEKELNVLKSRFVSTASHQFRTPLSIIQSSMAVLSMLREKMDDEVGEGFDKTFERIKNQVARMTALMNDVLSLGRISEQSIKPRKESCDLSKLCSGIVGNYNEIFANENSMMELVIEGEARHLQLDTSMIEHAISNFVSNAFKYSPQGSNSRLEINYLDHCVTVKIIDNGFGIPPEAQGRIFEPFYRAENVQELPGTGLGTSIAKEYLELNGASLEMQSEINKGSQFTITFPQTLS